MFRAWYPMAVHLLQGLFLGQQNTASVIGQRERLLALGKLSAGLTHELNNPAAAAGRAAHDLRDRVAGMRHKLAMIADGSLDRTQLKKLVLAQDEFVEKARHAPDLTALQTSDAEDELTDWLDDHDVTGGLAAGPGLRRGRARCGRPRGRRRRMPGLPAGGRAALAGLHGGDRGPARRDHRLDGADLDAGQRRQAVLADGPRPAPVARPARGPVRDADDAQAEARRHHSWSRSSTSRCRASRATPRS